MLRKTILTVSLIMAMALNAHALTYTFWGEDEGGVGSATMNITITGNTLTLTLDNTSPTSLIESADWNISAITGFGFNLGNDPLPTLESWSLTAFNTGNEEVTIGRGGTEVKGNLGPWNMGDWQHGVELDYLSHIDNGIANALYNPKLTEDDFIFRGPSAYLTKAVLTMRFDATPSLADPQLIFRDEDESGNKIEYWGATYVRFQRVGFDTKGSLKLVGDPFEAPGGGPLPTPVPEPGTIVLLGAGLLGLGIYVRRRKNTSA